MYTWSYTQTNGQVVEGRTEDSAWTAELQKELQAAGATMYRDGVKLESSLATGVEPMDTRFQAFRTEFYGEMPQPSTGLATLGYDQGDPTIPTRPQMGITGVTIAASYLLQRFGQPLGSTVIRFLRSVVQSGLVRWNTLPGWLRGLLVFIGVDEGVDIIFDDDAGDQVLHGPELPGGGLVMNGSAGPGGMPLGGVFVTKEWDTGNGAHFWMLSDGYIVVRKKDGSMRKYKPPKPIVVMPGGKGNLRSLLRADKVLNAQAKRLRKMLDRRAPRKQSRSKVVNVSGGPGNDRIQVG